MLKPIQETITPMSNINTNTSNTLAESKQVVNSVQEKVNKLVSEAPDLVAALEAVGAMYGIPATNIISDDAATSVRVEDDTIIAPPVANPAGQTKVIMQAIGSVLDYISQRIDDKLTTNKVIQRLHPYCS